MGMLHGLQIRPNVYLDVQLSMDKKCLKFEKNKKTEEEFHNELQRVTGLVVEVSHYSHDHFKVTFESHKMAADTRMNFLLGQKKLFESACIPKWFNRDKKSNAEKVKLTLKEEEALEISPYLIKTAFLVLGEDRLSFC